MEIIEQGEKQEPKLGKCINCKCIFRFTPHDTIPSTWFTEERLRCPNCGRMNPPYLFEKWGEMFASRGSFAERIAEINHGVKK